MNQHRALIVEDSEPMVRLIAGLLKTIRGLQVEFAHDGIDALKRLKQSRFDLILTDLEMPILSGMQFIAKLRNDPAYRNVSVVVVSAEGSDRQQSAARSAGATEFLQKPLQGGKLIEVVRRVLEMDADAATAPATTPGRAPIPRIFKDTAISRPSAPTAHADTRTKILVCDDDPTLQRLMSSFVAKSLRAEVKSAKDGFDALELLDEYEPDLLILDMMMPRVSGAQVLDELARRRERGLATPRVLVYSAMDLRRDVLRKGAHGFLQKPGNIEQIREAILGALAAEAHAPNTAFAIGLR
ncbi:MAG: response regulator [Chrysiogenetes bacterium]|nr:response regulator [Chrysiogenetes bacterium]